MKRSAIICLSCLIFFSCKTLKPVLSEKKGIDLSTIYDSLKLSETKFKTFEIKFNVQYTASDQNLNLKGNLKILHDSIIWVSLSPGLGIEAVRFMCNPDSLYILDRINKDYTKGTYKYLKESKNIDLDFKSLQAILLNNLFVYPSVQNEREEFIKTYSIKNDSTALSVYRKDYLSIENLILIDRNRYRILDYYLSDIPNSRNLNIKYSKENVDNNSGISKIIEIISSSNGKFLNIEINYSKITKDEDLSFPFVVPSSYKVFVY